MGKGEEGDHAATGREGVLVRRAAPARTYCGYLNMLERLRYVIVIFVIFHAGDCPACP